MKKLLVMVAVVTVSLFGLVGKSQAVGLGFYVEGAQGNGDFEYEPNGSFDVDPESKGVGLVFDTNPGRGGVFSYRLNLGYEKLDLPDSFGDSLELEGGVVTSTFCFAPVRQPTLRWWIGPQIKVGYYEGGLNTSPSGDYEMAAFGVGAATGFNIIAENVIVSISAGWQRVAYAGEVDDAGWTQDINADTSNGFINLAVLFGR